MSLHRVNRGFIAIHGDSSVSGPTHPHDLEGLVFDLDPNDAATLTTTGSAVNSIVDALAGAYTFSASSGKEPALVTNHFGTKPALHFNGSKGMRCASITLPSYVSVWMVLQRVSGDGIMLNHGPNAASNPGFQLYGGTANWAVYRDGAPHYDNGTSGWLGTTKRTVCWVYDTAEQNRYLDNSVVAKGTIGNTLRANSNVTALMDFGERGGSLFFNGYFGRVLLFNRGLTESEREFLQTYAESEYGV